MLMDVNLWGLRTDAREFEALGRGAVEPKTGIAREDAEERTGGGCVPEGRLRGRMPRLARRMRALPGTSLPRRRFVERGELNVWLRERSPQGATRGSELSDKLRRPARGARTKMAFHLDQVIGEAILLGFWRWAE